MLTESLIRVITYENSTNYQICHEKFFRRYICSSNSEDVIQGIFSMIKVNIGETHENIISKTLQTLNRMCRKENGWILMQIFTDASLQSNSYHCLKTCPKIKLWANDDVQENCLDMTSIWKQNSNLSAKQSEIIFRNKGVFTCNIHQSCLIYNNYYCLLTIIESFEKALLI